MREEITTYLPWMLSSMSIFMAWKNGDLWRYTWLFGLCIQCFWLLWIFYSRTWGFLPLCSFLFVVYIRNHFKWRRAAIAATGEIKP